MRAQPALEVIKSQSQYRTEAGLYDTALRSIAGIATMKLETPEDLKQALAISDRARPNLKFLTSKLILVASSDAAFSSAVRKKVSTKQAAEALIKELQADPKVVFNLEGAASVTSRLEQILQADATTFRQVAARLKEAAERIQKTRQARIAPPAGAPAEFRLVRASFNATAAPVSNLMAIPVVVGLILFAAVVVVILVVFKEFTAPPGGPDPIAECLLGEIDARYQTCLTDADNLPFPLNIAAKALCAARYYAEASLCIVTP